MSFDGYWSASVDSIAPNRPGPDSNFSSIFIVPTIPYQVRRRQRPYAPAPDIKEVYVDSSDAGEVNRIVDPIAVGCQDPLARPQVSGARSG